MDVPEGTVGTVLGYRKVPKGKSESSSKSVRGKVPERQVGPGDARAPPASAGGVCIGMGGCESLLARHKNMLIMLT